MDTRGLTAIHYPPSRYPNSDHAYPKHPLSAYRTLSRHARMQFLRALPCPQFQVLIRTDAIAIQETQRREIMQIGVIMERADKTGSTRESCPKQRPNTDPTAMTVGTSPRALPMFQMTRNGTRSSLRANRLRTTNVKCPPLSVAHDLGLKGSRVCFQQVTVLRPIIHALTPFLEPTLTDGVVWIPRVRTLVQMAPSGATASPKRTYATPVR